MKTVKVIYNILVSVSVILAVGYAAKVTMYPASVSALYQYVNPVPVATYLQEPVTGEAQYGFQLQQSTSLSQTLQTLSDWNTYVVGRSEYGLGLTASLVDRLSNADWSARQGGSATITPQQLADGANALINAKLSTRPVATLHQLN